MFTLFRSADSIFPSTAIPRHPQRMTRRARTFAIATLAVIGGALRVAPGQTCLPAVPEPKPVDQRYRSSLQIFGYGKAGHDLVTDRSGLWIAAWSTGSPFVAPGIGYDTDVVFSRSTNNGVTWSDPLPLQQDAVSDAYHDLDPELATDGDGTWIAVWTLADLSSDGDGPIAVSMFSRSINNGFTWSPSAALGANPDIDLAPRIISLGSGNWLILSMWHASPGDSKSSGLIIACRRSTDNGRTWTQPVAISSSAGSATEGSYSPTVARDKRGTLIVTWYSGFDENDRRSRDPDIYFARSFDGGITWLDTERLNSNGALDSAYDYFPKIAADGRGNWMTVWESTEIVDGEFGEFDILYAYSEDDGATWSDPLVLDSEVRFDGDDDRIPEIVADGEGNWFASWTRKTAVGAVQVRFAWSGDLEAGWMNALPNLVGLDDTDSAPPGSLPTMGFDRQGNWLIGWYSVDPATRGNLVSTHFALPDCNGNSVGDLQDIADGTSLDANGNGVPDECVSDHYGDINRDERVDIFDIFCVLNRFGGVSDNCSFFDVDIAGANDACAADLRVDIFDILAVLDAFAGTRSCCN